MEKHIHIPAKKSILALGLALFYIMAVWYKAGICFDTNDDRLISEILSGVISCQGEAHAVYINYLLAFPLSVLYKIFPHVPWYGASLVLFHLAAYGFMLDSACSNFRGKIRQAAVTTVFMMLFFSCVVLLAHIQFTSTAALLAIAGYVCLILNHNPVKRLVLFALLEFFSLLVRQNAMFMIQPYGMALCLGLILGNTACCLKDKIRQVCSLLAILLAIYAVAVSSHFAVYQSKAWDDYNTFNNMNVELYDFYGAPKYTEVKEILDKYHVSETAYLAYCAGTAMNWDISAECAEELTAYTHKKHTPKLDVKELLSTLNYHFFHENFWKMNQLMLVMTFLLTVYAILCRRFYLLLPIAGLDIVRMVIWGTLFWQGRHPNRVILPLFVCETAFILTLFLQDCSNQHSQRQKHSVFSTLLLIFSCVVFCYISFSGGKMQYYYAAKENAGKLTFMEGMWELQDYCRSHPDTKYLIESVSLSYYTGSALETRTAQPRNSIVTGCWYSNSPPMSCKLHNYLNGAEAVSLIIFQDGNLENHPVVQYFSELCSSPPELTDEFTLSHGGSYAVYRFLLNSPIF